MPPLKLQVVFLLYLPFHSRWTISIYIYILYMYTKLHQLGNKITTCFFEESVFHFRKKQVLHVTQEALMLNSSPWTNLLFGCPDRSLVDAQRVRTICTSGKSCLDTVRFAGKKEVTMEDVLNKFVDACFCCSCRCFPSSAKVIVWLSWPWVEGPWNWNWSF